MNDIPFDGLVPASFRGVRFFMPDSSSEVGRRVAAHYFPGLDIAAYDDMGRLPETISIEGLYVGQDYIGRARALKNAFATPGTATLMHPWFGAISVILIEPASISFSASELRVVRVSFRCERVPANLGNLVNAPALLNAAGFLIDSAMSFIETVSGSISRLRSDATSRASSIYFNLFNKSSLREFLNLPEAAISEPKRFGANFQNLTQTLIELTEQPVSAVSPAYGAPVKTPLSKAAALDTALNASIALISAISDAPSLMDQALLTAACGELIGRTGQLFVDVEIESRREALLLRQQWTSMVNKLIGSLENLTLSRYASSASLIERALGDFEIKLLAEINEIIGRLPQTTTIDVRTRDLWVMAYKLYGAELLEEHYRDLISRNKIRHPSFVTAKKLEIRK